MKTIRKNYGITLIALVITIVVLVILAGVVINMLSGENGILTKASQTKIETALGAIKEEIQLEQAEKIMQGENDVTPETLLTENKIKRRVRQEDDGIYYIYYTIKENAFDGMQGLGKGNITDFTDIFLIDDNLNIRYIAKNGKEYGDDINKKILEDETEVRFSSKSFSEYISKISGVTESEMKFKWMKNQTSLEITDPNVDSLEDLVFFPNLTSLTIIGLTLENLNGIENCSKLVYYKNGSTVGDNSKISELVNLKTYIDYQVIIEKAIEPLTNLNIETLKLYSYNDDSLKKISKIKSLKEILLSSTKINSLKGLNELTNLENIEINYSKIDNLEGIDKLQKLRTIKVMNSNISDITPLAYNKSLMNIDLTGNENIDSDRSHYEGERLELLNQIGSILDNGGIIYLDVDKLGLFTNYKDLSLTGQGLTDLSCLEGMTDLETLNLNYNNLTLEDEKSQTILSNMTNLQSISLIGNPVTNIKVFNNMKSLTLLNLGDNNNVNLKDIEDIISNINIKISDLSSLENCDPSKITRLYSTWNTFDEIPDLEEFYNLEEIYLSNCTIKNKDSFSNIGKVSSLKTLILEMCKLHGSMFDFSNLTNLTKLQLNGNSLWSEELENLIGLKNNSGLSIDLSNNSIIDAIALLQLNSSTKLILKGNVNLSDDSKIELIEKFGNNVTF